MVGLPPLEKKKGSMSTICGPSIHPVDAKTSEDLSIRLAECSTGTECAQHQCTDAEGIIVKQPV